jgi:multidrug resistance efflux pump
VRALFIALALAIGGCASLGLTPPTTAPQGIAYAYSTLAGTLTTLAQLAQSGAISRSDATAANTALMGVKTALDTANAASTSSAPVSVTVLTAATATIANVAAFLTCRQTKGATCQL